MCNIYVLAAIYITNEIYDSLHVLNSEDNVCEIKITNYT